jgi:hypothetical protein
VQKEGEVRVIIGEEREGESLIRITITLKISIKLQITNN